VGKVRNDQLGDVFSHDLRSVGVGYGTPAATSGPSTGRCLIVVTPDAQRTMSTYLGASSRLRPADIDKPVIERARILYLEGYLFDPPEAQEAFRTAAGIAHAAGRKVALTLSDPFCVDRHRAAFLDLVEHHVDILFANEAEICSLYHVRDFDAAAARVRGHCEVAALTRSERGSVVVGNDGAHVVAAHPVDAVVDTTGAGDLYAAGFMVGLSRGLPLPACGRLGALAAAEVISHVGARPMRSLAELAGSLLR
jgi:sugar/nucleoside kinase (ribokinase family)